MTDRSLARMRSIAAAITLTLSAGCRGEPRVEFKSTAAAPRVRLVSPGLRDITRVVGQPSFIESYERTSIYPKMTAYIEKWNLDIGDKVKKGDTLATLFVPELVEDYGTKKATVVLDRERVELAGKQLEVREADVKAAQAALAEAQSILGKFQAEMDRWDVEVKRQSREVEKGVIDPQVLLESTNQLRSSTAARNAARASIVKAEAELAAARAAAAQAKVDVAVAKAQLGVAESEERRLKAWVGYLTLTAPFDGIITVRNANTGDFVLPATGDPSALDRSPDISNSKASPIFVVDRTDIVRVFVDVPEQDADDVKVGNKAAVLARAFRDEEIPATVTRTSWALNIKSRTLRTEIDLPNPGGRLLPGMYAYSKVMIEHKGVRAIPLNTLEKSGERMFCMLHKDGKAVRTEVQTGVDDGTWVEVAARRAPRDDDEEVSDGPGWVPFDGTEQVILGDLSLIADGMTVEVENGPPQAGTKPAPGTQATTPAKTSPSAPAAAGIN